MNPIVKAAKATYNFFVGDAIILAGVVVAFGLATLLLNVPALAQAIPQAVTAAIFIALIVAGLALTLGRELRGRARQR
ncbi:MAG: hypothetical protein ABI068_10865 [Ktedonobacterales bacterium]